MKKVWYVAAILVAMSAVMIYISQGASSASTPKAPPVKIGYIGDSITHGTGNYSNAVDAEIAALGSDNYIGINHGVSGSTTGNWQPGTGMFDNALADFKVQNVHIVSIMLGTNDAWKKGGTSPEAYRKNLETIVGQLMRSGTVQQVIINYPPYMVPKSPSKDYSWRLEAYMRQIDGLVQDKMVLRGDTSAYTYFKDRQLELADGIHPTKEGYAHLGQLWASAYRRLMSNRALSPLFGLVPVGHRVQ